MICCEARRRGAGHPQGPRAAPVAARTYLCIYLSIYLSLSLYTYIYIYICIWTKYEYQYSTSRAQAKRVEAATRDASVILLAYHVGTAHTHMFAGVRFMWRSIPLCPRVSTFLRMCNSLLTHTSTHTHTHAIISLHILSAG